MNFDLNILNMLAEHHKQLMNIIRNKLENSDLKTNKELYLFMTNYFNDNKLNKAFPIGISVNNIIAHDSYHPDHIVIFKIGDFIKVDFGLEYDGNIIDCARTIVYGDIMTPTSINDCKEIVFNIEKYINTELNKKNKVSIQNISVLTNAQIVSKGYNTLDYLGGHTIEKGCVHGKKLILNKPLNLLPDECHKYINKNAELSEGEMFAIEVYIPNTKTNGLMIQNTKYPITHFEINKEFNISLLNTTEKQIFQDLLNKTRGLPYEFVIHSNFDKKIIKNLIAKNAIVSHLPLEWIDKNNNIKYIQYEDCYLIKDNFALNLTKNS